MANAVPTQKEMFTAIVEMAGANGRADIVEFAERKLAQLEKRAQAPRKPRFNAEAMEFAWVVADVLANAGAPMTNKEIVAALNDRGIEAGSQKVVAAIRKMTEGKMVNVVDGKAGDSVDVNIVVADGEKKSDPKTYAIN